MKNQRGFVGIGLLIAIVLGLIVVGGGAYYVVHQQSTAQAPAENFDNVQTLPTDTTTQNPAPVASKITITAPVNGATLPADQKTTIRWTIPSAVLDSFPQDFKLGLFINVQGQSGEGNVVGINDGTNDPRAGSVSWNIPAYFTSGSLKSGVYKIVAYLQATPKDQSRLCDPVASQGKHECLPSAADAAVMQRSIQVKGESGWFSIVSSGSVKDNNAPVITSLTGPTSLRVGEQGTWLLSASDDTATSLKYTCHVGLYKEMQASEYYGGGTSMASTEGTSLPVQYAQPGTSVAFHFTPSKSTTGKEYYNIDCNVIELLANNGELGARYQKSVQFTVSPATSNTSGLQTYTNSQYGFSVNYDSNIFKTYTNTSGYMGKPDYTNTLLSLFYGAGSITFRGDKTTTYEDCLRNSTDTKNVTPMVINGVTFYKSSSGEAGLGHSLSIDTYRTYYNGACYSIHTWIESDRTGDGSSYTDTTKEKKNLGDVLNTFKFNVSQTQPAIHSSTQPDWKTYNGTSAPVTFSYPGNYFVTETADNGYGNQIDINPGSKVGLDFVAQGTFTSNIEIQKSFVNPNDNLGTLQKSMDFDAGNKQNYYSPITIGGVQGYVGGFSNLQNSFGQSNTASIHFQKGNTLYRILLYGPISTDVYNTFVNSFKFTN